MNATTERRELEQLTVYGSKYCSDTRRATQRLDELAIPYRFIDIDHDMDARQQVENWNHGRPKMPTIVFGVGESPRLVEPSTVELDAMLRERGLLSGKAVVQD